MRRVALDLGNLPWLREMGEPSRDVGGGGGRFGEVEGDERGGTRHGGDQRGGKRGRERRGKRGKGRGGAKVGEAKVEVGGWVVLPDRVQGRGPMYIAALERLPEP